MTDREYTILKEGTVHKTGAGAWIKTTIQSILAKNQFQEKIALLQDLSCDRFSKDQTLNNR
ncbi:hypothetical protein [Desulfoluna sp.]|uniref:hypothetical protein n=1 Tax=Desulfoluna sp. TaxID=2045199 RepID=UPI00260B0FB1|nr:hypothetical protein [Desulfoluna sp.]